MQVVVRTAWQEAGATTRKLLKPLPETIQCTADPYVTLEEMGLSDIFLALGETSFLQLVRGVSIGKLKTYQLYDRVKLRFNLPKLNSESLRSAAPRLWSRASADEEFASDVSQIVLVSHLDMIKDVLDFVEIPHQNGFFAKDLNASDKLTGDWQQRVYDHFWEKYPQSLLIFYINHLDFELMKAETIFQPSSAGETAPVA